MKERGRTMSTPGTVLIVEDNADIREMYARYFHGQGYKTHTAGDGLEALACAGACDPELILLDLELPEMDGWELARRFRADPRTRSVRIVAVSGHAELSARMRALSAGVDLFVPKPVTPADLHARVVGLRPPPRGAS